MLGAEMTPIPWLMVHDVCDSLLRNLIAAPFSKTSVKIKLEFQMLSMVLSMFSPFSLAKIVSKLKPQIHNS